MSVIDQPPAQTLDQGWHPDPRREHNLRFHDGREWTEHVTHFGPMPCSGCGPASARS